MKRAILEQLKQWTQQKTRKPLILKGARQIGKTYILQELGQQCFESVHYFNFEKDQALAKIFDGSLDPKSILQSLSFHQHKPIDWQRDLIIFDEIQAVPKALTSLKYFCEELPEAYVCCAGSLLGVYLNPVSYPVGKVQVIPMYPMTFTEFVIATGDTLSAELLQNWQIDSSIPILAHERLWQLLKYYFVVGGLPEVVQVFCDHQEDVFVAMEKVRFHQQQLIDDYIADIAKHAGQTNAMHIKRIFQAIPEQLGRNHDGAAKKFAFKQVVPGIDRYAKLANAIDWLNAAGLLISVGIAHKAELPLASYTKENHFKLFLFDIGILGAMMDLAPKVILEADYGSYKGFFAENYVAQSLLASSHKRLFCWHEKSAELEFILQQQGALIPLEVKAGHVTQAKSLAVFIEKYQPNYGIILSAKPYERSANNRVYKIPLYLADSVNDQPYLR